MTELKKIRLSLERFYRYDGGLENLCLMLRPDVPFRNGTDVLEYLMTIHAITLRLSSLLEKAQWDQVMEAAFRRESGAEVPTRLEDTLREARDRLSEHYHAFRKSLGSVIEEGMDALGLRASDTAAESSAEGIQGTSAMSVLTLPDDHSGVPDD